LFNHLQTRAQINRHNRKFKIEDDPSPCALSLVP
jgi:hypothetical protein